MGFVLDLLSKVENVYILWIVVFIAILDDVAAKATLLTMDLYTTIWKGS